MKDDRFTAQHADHQGPARCVLGADGGRDDDAPGRPVAEERVCVWLQQSCPVRNLLRLQQAWRRDEEELVREQAGSALLQRLLDVLQEVGAGQLHLVAGSSAALVALASMAHRSIERSAPPASGLCQKSKKFLRNPSSYSSLAVFTRLRC